MAQLPVNSMEICLSELTNGEIPYQIYGKIDGNSWKTAKSAIWEWKMKNLQFLDLFFSVEKNNQKLLI